MFDRSSIRHGASLAVERTSTGRWRVVDARTRQIVALFKTRIDAQIAAGRLASAGGGGLVVVVGTDGRIASRVRHGPEGARTQVQDRAAG